METPHAQPSIIRNFYFVIGIIATLAYRVIVAIDDRATVQLLWYIGTIGFIIYFIHRYRISEKRSRIIKENNLEEKVAHLSGLSEQDRKSMEYIFHTLRSSKEKWNSIVIFVSSAIALIVGIFLDFIVR